MDDGKGKSAETEWMQGILPGVAADIGMGRGGVTLPSCSLNNSNQQHKAMNMVQNYQVAGMTSNINRGMWQQPQNTSVIQSMASILPPINEGVSQNQTSCNMISMLHQQKLLQNRVLEQGANLRPNICQVPMQSNTYLRNRRQHQPVQLQRLLGRHSASHMVNHQHSFNALRHNEQMTLQKNLESQSRLVRERMHPKLQTSAFHQSQNLKLVDQLKPGNQSQTMLLGHSQALIGSTPQAAELTNPIAWVDAAIHEILRMKQIYISDVIMLYKRAEALKQQETNAELANKLEKNRIFLEKIYTFLNLSRSDVMRNRKEQIYQMMNDINKYFDNVRAGKSLPVKQQQTHQVEAYSGNQMQQQQRENYLQVNSIPTSLHPSFSSANSLNVSSIVNSRQYSPMTSSAQQWTQNGTSQIGFDQRALRTTVHPLDVVAACQQNNLSTSLQGIKSSDYYVSPNQQNPVTKRRKIEQHLPTERNKQQKLNDGTRLRRFLGYNQKWSPLSPSSSSPCTISPQNSQQSSPQLHEMKDISSSKLSKSATSASPSAPFTPLTPSSMMQEINDQNEVVAADKQELVKSCLQRESEKQYSPSDKGEPMIKRLIEVVKSMSSKALNSALQDMDAVTNGITRHHVHGEPESTSSDNLTTTKILKKEPNDLLLQEIKEINKKLIEMKLDVMDDKNVSMAGTIITCSYIPVGFSGNTKRPSIISEHMLPNLLLKLLVPADYPDSSPTVLETIPSNIVDNEHRYDDWLMKAKTKLSLLLRTFSQPISVKEMAEAWEVCARKVFHEFAEQMGGVKFSSRYGEWENCLVAL